MKAWRQYRPITSILCSLYLAGCAAESESGNPGVCKLSCSGSVLGANDPVFEVKSLLADIDIQCPKGLTSPLDLDAVVVQFMFVEKVKLNELERRKPVPYLAFEPLILGILSGFKNPGNVDPTTGEVPQRYVGIRTPKKEWCSDSCGVATIEFEPRCLTSGTTNAINVSVHSGPLYSEKPAKVTVTTPDLED